MRLLRPVAAAVAFSFVALSSCNEGPTQLKLGARAVNGVTANAAGPEVRISEIHYDNTGTDVGEAIEISGPSGTNLAGWSLALYNGNPTVRTTYTTTTLTGVIPATCGTRGVVVVTYPSNGIQNGGTTATGTTDPDGLALVSPAGVVEFLSYEGVFVAANGPALGMTSVDIGVRELGTESASPVTSLKRAPSGTWSAPATNNFGVCNDDDGTTQPTVVSVTVAPTTGTAVVGGNQQFTATARDVDGNPIPGVSFSWTSSATTIATVNGSGLATGVAVGDATITAKAPNLVAGSASLHVDPAPPPADIRLSEIHYDNNGTDEGEAIEVNGPAGASVAGWSLVLYNGGNGASYNTLALSGTITDQCSGRGVLSYSYPVNGIQNGPDAVALVSPLGVVTEFLSYGGVFAATNGPANGMTSTDIGVHESGNETPGRSLQKDAIGWFGPNPSSFGACNAALPPFVSISGRSTLPVGFEDQFFASLNDGRGATVPSTFTWVSETPATATIDSRAVMHAVSAGPATITATAATGATGTRTFTMFTATAGPAVYANNVEFGTPTDADASDEVIITRTEFTSSFSRTRNIPNWVSFNLEASHYGDEDRCDCFTYDPLLPPELLRYTTADYTGAGAFAGYGIDRGHLARSFDRTSGNLDNADVYYFSNIIPQASDNNQGPWANMENAMGDLAHFNNKELFVIAGASGSKGTIKNEGKITIPTHTWKVVVVLPKDHGLADVHSLADLEVYAVIMPNDAGIRSNPNNPDDWKGFQVTVDAVEALSGYNLLSLLPDEIEIPLEANDHPPVADAGGPYSGVEGSAVTFNGSASSDPDAGDAVVSYRWTFGDGSTTTTASPTASHTYANDGSYVVTLTVYDNAGAFSSATRIANVSNVAPVIAFIPGGTRNLGTVFTSSSSFTDPGADAWIASVDYGDATGVQALTLVGKTFTISHLYTAPGTFDITVRVRDGLETDTRLATVTIQAPPVANAGGPYSANEGSALTLNGGASSDLDGAIVNWDWDFGDGSSGSGASVSHTYAQDGIYTVTLAVRDNSGLTNSTTTTATIANVAPIVSVPLGATLLAHETYASAGTFSDPADAATATVNYGDGSGTSALALGAGTYSLSHTYNAAGTYTVTLSVSDDDDTTTRTATVTVLTSAEAIQNIAASIDQLGLSAGNANSLKSKLDAAAKQIANGNLMPARNQLNALLNEINSMVQSGKISAANGAALSAAVNRLLASLI